MNAPYIHTRRRTFSASHAVAAQNATLTSIKTEDGATWNDIGLVLGKSEDRAAAYANTASPIDMPTFLAGCREWGGRFADPLDIARAVLLLAAPESAFVTGQTLIVDGGYSAYGAAGPVPRP